MLRRGQSWCRRWAKRRLCGGVLLGSRAWMVVSSERLDVDGVGGARLESIMAKVAEWRKSDFQESSWRWQM